MPRKLASVQFVNSISPIPNADNLEVARVLGWACVVRKGFFKEGQMVVYIEADAVVPHAAEFGFLKDKKYRVKPMRLRGQISMGLVISIEEAQSVVCQVNTSDFDEPWIEGQDVTARLRISKYEPPIAMCGSDAKGPFPSFFPKTNELRIQSIPNVLIRHKGQEVYITEKLEGCSTTFYINQGEFGVCSRNIELKDTPNSAHWNLARKLNIEAGMRALEGNLAIQGELAGPSIQGNIYSLKELRFYVFNIFDIDKQEPLHFFDMITATQILGLETVPIISYQRFLNDITVGELVDFADGKSQLADVRREGVVMRPRKPIRDEETGWLSFKCVSPKYLLGEPL